MEYAGRRKGPSIIDLAREADVSIATVSRVLNDSAYVTPEAAARVRSAAERLGYVRLRATRTKPAETRSLVGVLLPDIQNPFFATLLKGIQSVASTRGLDILLSEADRDPAGAEDTLRGLGERGVRAVLVVSQEGFDAPGDGLELERRRGEPVPLVFMDRRIRPQGINFVGSENYQGAYNAAVYLGSLGHREVLYIAGDRGLSTEIERYDGFSGGMAASGRRYPASPTGSEALFVECGFSRDAARVAVAERIAAGREFSAIFAADDYMAYGALDALREAGLGVPEDVSLVGFDDLPFSALVGLTTVRQQAFEMGVASMSLALDLAEGRRRGPQSVILSTSLIVRGSCAVRAFP